MRSKSIILSALLLFLASAYIYFYELPAEQKALQAKKPFAGLDFGKLKKLEILNSKNESKPVLFSNQKAGEKQTSFEISSWKLESTEYSALDSASFGSIVNQLMSYDLGSALPEEDLDSDLSVYGLKNPELELSVTVISEGSSESVLKFSFGKRSDFVGKRYVALYHRDGSRDIFMTDDLLFFAANKNVAELRKKDPLEFRDSVQKQIKIKSAKFPNNLEIKKVKSNVPGEVSDMWQISSPYLASAEDQRITDMLRALKNLKVTSYIEKEQFVQLQSLKDSPLIEIVLSEDESATSQYVRIARRSSEDKKSMLFWSKYPETIFEFEDDKLFSYFDDLDSYRKTAFFRIDSSLVKSIEVEKQNAESLVRAVKTDEKWTLNNNSEQQADSVFIEEYVQDLASVHAAEFPDSEELKGDWKQSFGLLSPTYKVTVSLISLDSREIKRSLVVGKEIDFDDQSKAYFAAVDDLSEPFIIDKSAVDKIIPNVSAWMVVPTPETEVKVSANPAK